MYVEEQERRILIYPKEVPVGFQVQIIFQFPLNAPRETVKDQERGKLS